MERKYTKPHNEMEGAALYNWNKCVVSLNTMLKYNSSKLRRGGSGDRNCTPIRHRLSKTYLWVRKFVEKKA